MLTFATGDLARLTYDDGNEQLDGWSRDGRWIYFSSTSHDIAGMNDVFRVSADGGTPMEVAADRYTNEYFSSAAPDGAATGDYRARDRVGPMVAQRPQPSRRSGDVDRARRARAPQYEAVTTGGAKEMWPMWAADGGRCTSFRIAAARRTCGPQRVG